MGNSANDISVGNVLSHNNKLYRVSKREHVKPGKGGAFIQVEMKDIITGTKVHEKFRSNEEVNIAYIETQDYQFLYIEGDDIVVMDLSSYEQFNIPKAALEEKIAFLQDGMMIKVETYEGKPIIVHLPERVICEIAETEPTLKGQTVTPSYKPAILDNGVRIMVPPFIATGEKVVVRTEDLTYVERAK